MRHVLVTGAGGGLGACLCDQLAATGDTVFATDVDLGAVERFQGKPGVIPLRMDVTSARDEARARKKIETMTDGLDGLVCCAGIFRAGALVEADGAEMELALDINVMGVFRTVQAFFPLLAKRGGMVVLIGSEVSRCAMPFNGPYMVSKCALRAYADSLRRELMFIGMRVVVVQPGAIRTPLLSGARLNARGREDQTMFPAQLELVRRMLAREWETGMEPADVARVIVRALRSRKPRSVYRVGNDPFRAMLGRLPTSWADLLIRAFVASRSARAFSVRPPGPSRR